MSRSLLVLLVLAIPVMAVLYVQQNEHVAVPGIFESNPVIFFNKEVPLRVAVLETAEERERGLSGRESLPTNEGLLFVFEENGYHGMWMKDMLFPIDIIWISEDRRVVHIERAVRPDSFPRVFEPRLPARFVVETNANYAETFGIGVGDEVAMPAWLLKRMEK